MSGRSLMVGIGCVLLLSQPLTAQLFPSDPPRGAVTPRTPASNERDLESRMLDMRTLDARMRAKSQRDEVSPAEPHLTSEMVEEIKMRRRIDTGIIDHYAKFLKSGNTGVFRLFPDFDCVTSHVVKIDGQCENFVAMSSGFSFRNIGYSDRTYHDIYFDRGELTSFDFFAQGIFAELGDVPIESIEKSHPAVEALKSYNAELSTDETIKNARELKTGKTLNGIALSDHVTPVAGKTYLLRHVAFSLANSVPALSKKSSLLEKKFLSLAYDNRDDSVVAFRVVKMDADGSGVIVWKALAKEAAPKLKFLKGTPLVDLRDDRELH